MSDQFECSSRSAEGAVEASGIHDFIPRTTAFVIPRSASDEGSCLRPSWAGYGHRRRDPSLPLGMTNAAVPPDDGHEVPTTVYCPLRYCPLRTETDYCCLMTD